MSSSVVNRVLYGGAVLNVAYVISQVGAVAYWLAVTRLVPNLHVVDTIALLLALVSSVTTIDVFASVQVVARMLAEDCAKLGQLLLLASGTGLVLAILLTVTLAYGKLSLALVAYTVLLCAIAQVARVCASALLGTRLFETYLKVSLVATMVKITLALALAYAIASLGQVFPTVAVTVLSLPYVAYWLAVSLPSLFTYRKCVKYCSNTLQTRRVVYFALTYLPTSLETLLVVALPLFAHGLGTGLCTVLYLTGMIVLGLSSFFANTLLSVLPHYRDVATRSYAQLCSCTLLIATVTVLVAEAYAPAILTLFSSRLGHFGNILRLLLPLALFQTSVLAGQVHEARRLAIARLGILNTTASILAITYLALAYITNLPIDITVIALPLSKLPAVAYVHYVFHREGVEPRQVVKMLFEQLLVLALAIVQVFLLLSPVLYLVAIVPVVCINIPEIHAITTAVSCLIKQLTVKTHGDEEDTRRYHT